MKWLIELLFPRRCVGCGRQGELLCGACWLKVDFLYDQTCVECGRAAVGGVTHPGCRRPGGLDGLWCLARYRGPMRLIVRGLKYSYLTVISDLIEQLILYYIERETMYLPAAVLMPAPVHRQVLRKRGYNQAEVIAEELARVWGLPILRDVVVKTRANVSQTRLNRQQRKLNVKGVFDWGIDLEEAGKLLAGQKVIVVDDVVTTGATMSEMAGLLKKSGVSEVWGFALCRD